MHDMEARHIIEAVRSGIPSRAVGSYFTEARPQILNKIRGFLNAAADEGKSSGMIVSGRYGEGKTHLLNTVFSMAHAQNMVVSMVPLSKEIPFDKMHQVYLRLMHNTYLPGSNQPGFMDVVDGRLKDTTFANDLLLYANTELERNRICYLLRTYLKEDDDEEKIQLQADLEGDFLTDSAIKRRYRANYHEPAKFDQSFVKTKNTMDYFQFMSYLFERMGYNGWVLLFDEAELIGRLGKKGRLNAYRNMAEFLMPSQKLRSVFSLFAVTASYAEDVIEGKHDYENLKELYPDDPEPMKTVLGAIEKATELKPLTEREVEQVVEGIIELHGRAYGWDPKVSVGCMMCELRHAGFLLRTKLRTAIEILDQKYQYGDGGTVETGELMENEIPDLTEMDE